MDKRKSGPIILRILYGFFVLLPLLLSSEIATGESLQYKLAMLGYSDQEIENILSKKRTIRRISFHHKKEILGFSVTPPPTAAFSQEKAKEFRKKDTPKKPAPSEPIAFIRQPVWAMPENILLSEAKPFLAIIQDAASQNNLLKSLVLSVIKVESNFDSQAVSRKGAMGLMQLMPGTARDLGVTDPFDPAQNIFGGARYLSDCVKTFKDLRLALAAYNAGPSKVAKLKRVPLIEETQQYVEDILYYNKLYAYLLAKFPANPR